MKMLILQNGQPRQIMMFVDDNYDSTEVIEKASATIPSASIVNQITIPQRFQALIEAEFFTYQPYLNSES
jgi:AmiR/NasT family two-component response regulator